MSNKTSKSKYGTLSLVLSFFVGFLGVKLYDEVSKNNSDAQSLREGNEQIYKELENVTNMMITNSDIPVSYTHLTLPTTPYV